MAYFNSSEVYKKFVDINITDPYTLLGKPRDSDQEKQLTHNGIMFHTFNKMGFEKSLGDEIGLKITMDEFFKNLFQNINSKSNLCIDGPSAMAKSSMIGNAKSQKVNNFININKNNCYNNNPVATASYYIISSKMNNSLSNIVFDRSPISNLAYGLCFYIMNILTTNQLGYRTFSGICSEFIQNTNLVPFLEHVKSQKYNILIMIDSSFSHYSKRFNRRGYHAKSRSDINKSLVYEYWIGQTTAFAYLANVLNLHCIDINKIRMEYPTLDDDFIFNIICTKFQDTLTLNFSNDISTININPQTTSMGSDEVRDGIIDTFVLSNR